MKTEIELRDEIAKLKQLEESGAFPPIQQLRRERRHALEWVLKDD